MPGESLIRESVLCEGASFTSTKGIVSRKKII